MSLSRSAHQQSWTQYDHLLSSGGVKPLAQQPIKWDHCRPLWYPFYMRLQPAKFAIPLILAYLSKNKKRQWHGPCLLPGPRESNGAFLCLSSSSPAKSASEFPVTILQPSKPKKKKLQQNVCVSDPRIWKRSQNLWYPKRWNLHQSLVQSYTCSGLQIAPLLFALFQNLVIVRDVRRSSKEHDMKIFVRIIAIVPRGARGLER